MVEKNEDDEAIFENSLISAANQHSFCCFFVVAQARVVLFRSRNRTSESDISALLPFNRIYRGEKCVAVYDSTRNYLVA